jgi:hypothetical protein
MGDSLYQEKTLMLTCERCCETVPYHDTVTFNDEVIDIAEARRIRDSAGWVPVLCSWCSHMARKDD